MKICRVLEIISAIFMCTATAMGFYVVLGKTVAPTGQVGAFDQIQYLAVIVAAFAFMFLAVARYLKKQRTD